MGCGPSKDAGVQAPAAPVKTNQERSAAPAPAPAPPEQKATATRTKSSGDDDDDDDDEGDTVSHLPQTTSKTEKPQNEFKYSVNGTLAGLSLSGTSDNNKRSAKSSKKGNVTHHLRNVFVPRIDQDDLSNFRPPVFEKEETVETFLRTKLRENFIFQQLPDSDLNQIIKAFEKCQFKNGEAIIKQGDNGDYFFIVYDGDCTFQVNDETVGTCSAGAGFGELALLYSSPRAATVLATSSQDKITTCYRVDQKTFRYVLQNQNQLADTEKLEELKKISFLKGLATYQLQKLSSAMTLKAFRKDDYIVRKGEVGDHFFILHEGEVQVTDISVGTTVYEDFTMGPGEHFGERAIIQSEPRAANVRALTDGYVFSIDRATFENVLGNVTNLIIRSQDKHRLAGIKSLHDTYIGDQTLDVVSGLIEDTNFSKGSTIVKQGVLTEPLLYIVRSGKVHITRKDGTLDSFLSEGELFGEEHLTMDVGRKKLERDNTARELNAQDAKNKGKGSQVSYDYSIVATEDTVCGVLKIKDCRTIFDTTRVGLGKDPVFEKSSREMTIRLEDLKRHNVLGEGTFGQVWLVSAKDENDEDVCYALKIQSKYELIESGQAKGVVQEMEIMSQLKHPFLLPIIRSYQDKDLLYMLLGMVQGGELYNLVHTDRKDGIKEEEARFYGAGVAEALGFMHRRHIVYRDLKPENVLIDNQGYPVVIDFGFAKYVPEKTYTFCGSPLYMAPEIILNKGHNVGADHWSLGCLIYEMITGDTPFEEHTDQIALFRGICSGRFKVRSLIKRKKEVLDLCTKFLEINPSKRLGQLAGGQMEIFKHPWFGPIDFNVLRNKEIPAPWVPAIDDKFDTSNFISASDRVKDKTKMKYPKLSAEEQELFAAFGRN